MSFKSYRSYDHFSWEVRQSTRYIHSDAIKGFLSNVLETSRSYEKIVKPGEKLWRAQLGSDWIEEDVDEPIQLPFPPERMKPLQYEASEGRVNSKGIPCLYLATDQETAMYEVRPWLGVDISVWQFKTTKELRLIDCSVHAPKTGGFRFFFEEPDEKEKEKAVWADIDRAFSRPVTLSDKSSDYVPTQIIAELFKTNGSDGILYKSSLADGLNLALFDIGAATVGNYALVRRVKDIKFSFDSGQEYFSESAEDK